MTPANFILASLRHYRRMHVAVGLGVAVATAVLTGALLVGDSVRGSLRDLTLQRLGQIDSVLVAGHFFRTALAEEVGGEPAILMPGTLESGSGANARRATQVSIVGVRDEFWKLGDDGPKEPLAAGDVAITEPLAHELGVAAGDTILLRIPAAEAIPADSPLGEKERHIARPAAACGGGAAGRGARAICARSHRSSCRGMRSCRSQRWKTCSTSRSGRMRFWSPAT